MHPTNLPYPDVKVDPSVLDAIPRVPEDAWIAPNAVLVGQVSLGARTGIWYGCVLRGDIEAITIGDETNIQDLTLIHTDPGFPCTVGSQVTVGHRVILHGCVVGDGAVIGMGAIILTGARVGRGAVIAAGAVVLEGTVIPDETLWAGVPAVQRKVLGAGTATRWERLWKSYVNRATFYRARFG